MTFPIDIRFHDLERSEAVEAAIAERATALGTFDPSIMRCRVVVERIKGRGHQGHLYAVRIDLHAPGEEIVIDRDPGKNHAHEDVYVAIRDAFDAARRRVEDAARRRGREVKEHEVPDHGRVTQIFPAKGYGFIRAATGEDVYFHRNAVADDGFDALAVGAEVRFAVVEGESARGPQATTVTPIGKHHLAQ